VHSTITLPTVGQNQKIQVKFSLVNMRKGNFRVSFTSIKVTTSTINCTELGAESRTEHDTCTTCCYCLIRHPRAKEIKFPLILIVKGLTDGTRRKKERKYALKLNPNGLTKRIWGDGRKNEIVLTSSTY